MPKPEAVVTVRTPSELVAAIPHLLGYFPGESIVVVCMHGSRPRTGLVVRYDLWLAEFPEEFLELALPRIDYEDPDSLLVVLYAESGGDADGLPYQDFADELADQLETPHLDVLLAAGGRWWSYLCDDRGCCPPEGTPVALGTSAETLLAAERAYAGTAVLPDRQTLVSSLGFASPEDMPARREAVSTAIDAAAGLSPETARRLAHRLVIGLIERCADPRERLADSDIDELAGLVEHLWARDEFLVHAIDPDDRGLLMRVIGDVVRRVPPPYDAPVCSILGWLAYANGDGTLANIAVDRALASDPDYALAKLIGTGLANQIPPRVVQEAMTGAAADLHGRSAGG